MEDRIGQRLLRMLGLNVDALKLEVKWDKPEHRQKAEKAEGPGTPHAENAGRPVEDGVARFEANPFMTDESWKPQAPKEEPKREEPDASQLADAVPAETRRDEVTEKAPAHIEETEHQEKQDVDESKESDRGDDQQQEKDEQHGGGWVMEEAATEESDSSKGLRNPEVLGEESRCHGVLEDGSRCLRKPTDGKAYCLEHSAGTPEASTAEVTTPDVEAVTENRVPVKAAPEPEPQPLTNFGSKTIL